MLPLAAHRRLELFEECIELRSEFTANRYERQLALTQTLDGALGCGISEKCAHEWHIRRLEERRQTLVQRIVVLLGQMFLRTATNTIFYY